VSRWVGGDIARRVGTGAIRCWVNCRYEENLIVEALNV